MHKQMFLISLACLIINSNDIQAAKNKHTDLQYYLIEPEWRKKIWFGEDRDMPIDRDYFLSIEINDKLENKPKNIIELIDILTTILPNWYKHIMVDSYSHDKNCEVFINRKSYDEYVAHWIQDTVFVYEYNDFMDEVKNMGYSTVLENYRIHGLGYSIYRAMCSYLVTSEENIANERFDHELNIWKQFILDLDSSRQTDD